jgi:YD repeat-containing protein
VQASGIPNARDPNGVGYYAVYDELGRMTAQTDTFGDTTDWGYDDASDTNPGREILRVENPDFFRPAFLSPHCFFPK